MAGSSRNPKHSSKRHLKAVVYWGECSDTRDKFAYLGADSLDTVEIMMALDEQFGVSIGEGGAENIVTVQDAAVLIEKVRVA